jgi:cellulose synthase/poly-beta-1,6-N-acetylglucosamine synthase-like glycosyltransferase
MKSRAQKRQQTTRKEPWPSVSVIVAARNEEANIRNLLASLAALNYPKDRLQIVLGDDGSTDSTHDIFLAWKDNLPDCRIVQVSRQLPGLTGKGNVLAQLCHQATGDIFLFTDADCTAPPDWAHGMVRPFMEDEGLGILTGVTIPIYKTPFEKLQAVDWISAQFMIWAMSLVRIPITAMGNNMAISARAYKASGGFEATAGGITEDHAIFHLIYNKNLGWAHRFEPEILAKTLPMPNTDKWLEQRLRWFSGAMKLPLATQLPFWFQMLFYPLLVAVTLTLGWRWAFMVWAMKFSFQTFMFMAAAMKIGQFRLAFWSVVYEFWSVWACWLLWIHWIKSPVITWKGREFSKASA